MLKQLFTKDFVCSKRVIGAIVTLICLVLARKHIIVPDVVQENTIDELVIIAGLLWTAATKAIDLYLADKAALQQ